MVVKKKVMRKKVVLYSHEKLCIPLQNLLSSLLVNWKLIGGMCKFCVGTQFLMGMQNICKRAQKHWWIMFPMSTFFQSSCLF